MPYSVQVVKTAEAEVPGPEIFWMSHWEQLFFYMVVAKGNGVTVIVNTRPPSDLSDLNSAWKAFAGSRCQMKRAEAERPEHALARLGIDPAEVDFVLLTPLQAYSTANLQLFPNATICCSRRGWVEDIVARDPVLHVPRHLCISDSVLQYLLFDAKDRFRLLDDEEEVCPGVRAWWAGTHHRSSMVYSFETSAGIVMTGDCAMKYANVDGYPLGIAESIMEGETAYRRIRKEASIFLPLYDPEVLQRYPDGRIS
jgi:glyoxylase-like metal-dependent hydrolase (beta-lactamase superfamily II)